MVNQNEAEGQVEVIREVEDFGIEALSTKWEAFKSTKKKDGKDKEVALLNQEYSLKDHVITIKSTNDVFTIIFNDLKTDLLVYLRKQLRNGKIKLEIETLAIDDSKMIYTNREKFDHLSEKYPELKKMQDRLGLDTDF